MFWSGWGKDREGMETGDAGREDGGAAICVAPAKGATKEITGEDYNK